MALVVESTTTAVTTSTGLTLTKPTGLVEGELLVSILSSFSATAQATGWTTLSTWTLATSLAGSNDLNHSIQYKIATAGDVAASNFTFAHPNSCSLVGRLLRVSGNNPSAPLGTTDGENETASSASFNGSLTPYTPAVDGALVIMQVGGHSTTGGANTTVSSYAAVSAGITFTEGYDQVAYGTSKTVVGSAYGIQATAAELNTYTASFSTSMTFHYGQFAVFLPPVNATGTNTLITTTSTTFNQAGACDTIGGTNTLATATTSAFAQSGKGGQPTAWTTETKPTTTWTPVTKS